MTTKVTIDPANHRVTLQVTEGAEGDQTTKIETLEPGDPPKDVFIYGSRVLTVRETPE